MGLKAKMRIDTTRNYTVRTAADTFEKGMTHDRIRDALTALSFAAHRCRFADSPDGSNGAANTAG